MALRGEEWRRAPAVVTALAMPPTFLTATGIALGCICCVAVKLLRRAGLVYLGAVALVLIRLMFAARNGEPVGIGTLVDALLLRQAGSVAPDFLAMYAVLVFLSPLVLWAARYRREWIPITITAGTWIAAQFLPELDDAWLMRLSWSFVFVVGIAIGCRWPELSALAHRVPRRTRRVVGIALVVVFLVTALAAEFLIFWNHHLLVAANRLAFCKQPHCARRPLYRRPVAARRSPRRAARFCAA